MAFIFTCGTHTFQRLLQGYENVTVRCQNCGNYSGRVYRRWEWFTFCFVVGTAHPLFRRSSLRLTNHQQPIIPFSLKPWHVSRIYVQHKDRVCENLPDADCVRTGSWMSHLPLLPGSQVPPGRATRTKRPNTYAQLRPAAAAGTSWTAVGTGRARRRSKDAWRW